MAIISKKYAHLNTSDSGSLHKKLDATEAYITGSFTAASDAHIVGISQHDALAKFGDVAATFTSVASLVGDTVQTVQGITSLVTEKAALFGDAVVVLGETTINNAFNVSGTSDLSGSVTMSNDLTVQGQLAVHSEAEMHDVLPHGDLAYDLGSAAARWAEIHAGTAAFTNLEVDYLDVAVTASFAQLTGSAGAVFSAGDIIATLGKISASAGNLEAGGQLVVAGNADLNGQLDVAAAADFHGAVHMYDTADIDSTLNVDGQADFQDKVVAHDDVEVQGGLTVSLTANVAGNFSVATNKFTVAASSGDAAVAGDLVVSGDLTVMGDRIEAQVTELKIEDGLITLMSGSTGRAISNDAGIEVEVGASNGEMPAIKFANAIGGASGSWVSNLDWIPSEDLKYDLGIQSNRWRELNLSGDANVGGDLTVEGAADLQGAVAIDNLAVAHAATFAAGIAVTGTGSFSSDLSAVNATLSGDLSAVNGSFSADIDAVNATLSGDLSAVSASLSGDLSVTGASTLHAVSATDISATSATLTGDLSAVNATLSGDLSAVDGTFSGDLAAVSASLSGDLSVAQAATFAGPATFNGVATFNGTFAVPGTGSFGALKVAGVDMSPISGSALTVDSGETEIFSFAIADGEMMKLEAEVIARGRGTEVGDNATNGATWKISIAAMRTGATISAAASELTKEFFGALGMNLDVKIEDAAGKIKISAVGAASAGGVYWNAQVTKKMIMDSAGLPVENRA